jgi:hypothetical protein
MGFRFRKRIKLFPGLWLNASKSGISASVGGHGATLNLNRKGVSRDAIAAGLGRQLPNQAAKAWGKQARDSQPAQGRLLEVAARLTPLP